MVTRNVLIPRVNIVRHQDEGGCLTDVRIHITFLLLYSTGRESKGLLRCMKRERQSLLNGRSISVM